MKLFDQLFKANPPDKECPRCLGKGNVDMDDIKRLGRELKWLPGSCAYCDGTGKVDALIEKNVPVDTTYLSLDLPEDERYRLIHGDAETWERARLFDIETDNFIKQVCYLHFNCGLSGNQITDFYLIPSVGADDYEIVHAELLDSVNRVIAGKSGTA